MAYIPPVLGYLLVLFLALILLLHIYAIYVTLNTPFNDHRRKWYQMLINCLVPIFGPLFTLWVNWPDYQHNKG
ncbi:hypothetical protein [Marinicella meishanensis]|uniref:hypothetical protein n=1 Tax=Marinicella meishanensis TaxID=2873263 RepID=UPI001CBF263E|nr:hypothetical protein [Marinicella sp. NBU2979]